MTLSLGFTFNASWVACLDIDGKYSGSVSGWMNLWGNIGGILTTKDPSADFLRNPDNEKKPT
jgi:hypothetical protein